MFFLVSADHELVFINFYVDWCRYSNLMAPIFEEASKMVILIFRLRSQTKYDMCQLMNVKCVLGAKRIWKK